MLIPFTVFRPAIWRHIYKVHAPLLSREVSLYAYLSMDFKFSN